ncbi:hypothetical protein Cus16_1817 [Curtobacterium sp. ER1/6]|nr:hypothetical protein Cus16_1817 [Curtobacterium sp. ER1/6]
MALGLLAAAVAAWRLGAVTLGTAWAEDAGRFLRDRIALGPVDSLLHPYAGYLHLVPRLLVDAAWALPVQWYAVALALGACGIVGVAATAVTVLARDVVPWWPARVLLALVPALVPLGPYEVLGNAANVHWTLLFLAPWLFAYQARTWSGAAVQAALAALVVLSEVQAVLFLPLLALALLPGPTARTPGGRASGRVRAVPVVVLALGGSAAQVVTAVTTHRASRPGGAGATDIVAGWLLQPVAALWQPDVGAVVRAVAVDGWAAVLVPVGILVLLLVAAAVVAPWRTRWFLLATTTASLAVWWAALSANPVHVPWASPSESLGRVPPLRYAAPSGAFLLAATLVAAGALARHRRTGVVLARIGGWALVGVVVVATLGNAAPGPTRRADGPIWADQVAAARVACERDPGGTVVVRAAPWDATVPCGRLVGR